MDFRRRASRAIQDGTNAYLLEEFMKQAGSRKRKQGWVAHSGSRKKMKLKKTRAPRNSSLKSSGITTKYKDVLTYSKKKRMSKKAYKKRKFAKRVRKALVESDKSHCLLEIMDDFDATFPAGVDYDFQLVLDSDASTAIKDIRIGLYGHDARGLRRFFSELRGKFATATPATTAVTTVTQPFQQDFSNFKGAVVGTYIDMTFENLGTNTASNQPIIMDIYECVNRIDIDDSVGKTAYQCWVNQISNSCVDPVTQQLGATAANWERVQVSNSGLTPYHVPMFAKYWKIVKKTKLNLRANEIVTYRAQGPKKSNFTVGQTLWSTDGSDFSAGMVKDFIIVLNPTYNTISNLTVMRFQATKHYFLKTPDLPSINNVSAVYKYA